MTKAVATPRMQIRRFDIFAEWNRLKAGTRKHMDEANARAYGLAVAKVVAARKFGGDQAEQTRELKQRARNEDTSTPWWEQLGSTDEFEQKIIERMGAPFYREVFQPMIQNAWDAGKSYEDIRDTFRNEWNAQPRS